MGAASADSFAPPYSIKWEGSDNGTLINDPRFSPAGVLAPKSKADFAFIMHCLSWLATNGTAAIVCFPGNLSFYAKLQPYGDRRNCILLQFKIESALLGQVSKK